MKILILGAGAIGSNLTNRLVSDLKGEHDITVLDMDTVEERNVIAGTQFYMRDQIGMSKVDALQYNVYKFHEREINIINREIKTTWDFGTFIGGPKFTTGKSLYIENSQGYDLIIDCFDNKEAREITQYSCLPFNIPLLHTGFSDQFTFAIEWAENYQVPDDIISGMDICEMEGASSFVNYVSSIAGLVVQKFIKESKKIDIVGNRMSHTILK